MSRLGWLQPSTCQCSPTTASMRKPLTKSPSQLLSGLGEKLEFFSTQYVCDQLRIIFEIFFSVPLPPSYPNQWPRSCWNSHGRLSRFSTLPPRQWRAWCVNHDIHILMNDANFTEKTWNIDHAMIDISILYTSSCNHIYVQSTKTKFIEIMYLSTLQQKIKYL